MERNRSSKMSELDSLLEKHKQMEKRSIFKSVYQQEVAYQNNINYANAGNIHYDTQHYIQQPGPPLLRSDIASINTHHSNHPRKKPTIHLNPRVQVKTPIHINPKIIQNIANIENPVQAQFQQNNQPFAQSSVPKVHINPKLMTQMIYQKPEESHVLQEPNIPHIPHASLPPKFPVPPVLPAAPIPPVVFPSLIPTDSCPLSIPVPLAPNQSKVKPIKINSRHNIHDLVSIPLNRPTPPVSPNVEEKSQKCNSPVPQEESISSNDIIEEQSSANHVIHQEESPVCYVIKSKNKLVKGSSPKKNSNYSLVSVSKRKLIRMKKTSESNGLKSISPSKRRLSFPRLRKAKVSLSEEVLGSTSELLGPNRIFKIHDEGKMHWYSNSSANTSKLTNTSANKERLNIDSSTTYDSHRSQLTWTAPSVSVKRNRNLSSHSDEYFIAEDGKKLLRLNPSKRKSNEYLNKSTSSTSSNKSCKSYASNKVKQRSLQILREKMRKNNQPCLLFQRFGYCANEANSTCHKVHDKKQVSLCRNFLQGKCHLEKCPLSHNIGPEKMPTCKFFLDGCCVRDNCPYLHVKVPSKNPLCVDFLRGYCSLGDKCLNRHDNQCQEFKNTGKCRKGKLCPLIHDSHLIKRKKLRENTRRKNNELNVRKGETIPDEPQIVKRYYDEVSEDLISQKREKLLTQIKIIKNVHEKQFHDFGKEKDCNTTQRKYSGAGDSTDCEKKQNNLCNKQRPPIGPLPAYIPID